MTARWPIVNVAGTLQELPAGDFLNDPTLAATADQIVGSGGTVLEVEGNTKAARITFRPFDGASATELAYSIAHYSIGFQGGFSATTGWTSNSEMMATLFPSAGVAVVRKVTVASCTTAVSGSRVGSGRIDLMEAKPFTGLAVANLFQTPPIGGTINPGSGNYQSLNSRQITPTLQMEYGGLTSTPNGNAGDTGVVLGARPVASVMFGVKATVGNDLPPTVLFDAYNNNSPFVMALYEGMYLGMTYPLAVTSQSVAYSVTVQWDEWTPVPRKTIVI